MNWLALSGTATHALSGTRFAPYREPEQVVSHCRARRTGFPSNYTNSKSFGFLLTGSAFRTPVRDPSQSGHQGRLSTPIGIVQHGSTPDRSNKGMGDGHSPLSRIADRARDRFHHKVRGPTHDLRHIVNGLPPNCADFVHSTIFAVDVARLLLRSRALNSLSTPLLSLYGQVSRRQPNIGILLIGSAACDVAGHERGKARADHEAATSTKVVRPWRCKNLRQRPTIVIALASRGRVKRHSFQRGVAFAVRGAGRPFLIFPEDLL